LLLDLLFYLKFNDEIAFERDQSKSD